MTWYTQVAEWREVYQFGNFSEGRKPYKRLTSATIANGMVECNDRTKYEERGDHLKPPIFCFFGLTVSRTLDFINGNYHIWAYEHTIKRLFRFWFHCRCFNRCRRNNTWDTIMNNYLPRLYYNMYVCYVLSIFFIFHIIINSQWMTLAFFVQIHSCIQRKRKTTYLNFTIIIINIFCKKFVS